MRIKKFLIVVFAFIILVVAVSIFTPSDESSKPTETATETVDTDTRNMIWEFVLSKGYDVKTIVGVPEIYETDVENGWQVKTTDGKEYAVVVYEGSVSAIKPMK